MAELLARYVADPASLTPREEETVNRWLDSSEANRTLYTDLVSGKSLERFGEVSRLTDRQAHLRALELRLFNNGRRRRLVGLVAGAAAAAAVAVAFLLGPGGGTGQPIRVLPEGSVQAYIMSDAGERVGLGNADTVIVVGGYRAVAGVSAVEFASPGVTSENSPEAAPGKTLTVVVPAGGVYSVTLGDGTTVHLNSDSRLRFPETFGPAAREVELTGEAFFEVAPDAARPFSVRTGPMTTRALGTSFNVTAYEADGAVHSTLVTGAVEVTAGQQTLTLTPGHRATLDAGGLSVSPVDLAEATAWRGGEFIFAGLELEEILKVLARWYDVDYTYADRYRTGRHTFAGKAHRGEDLASILGRINSLGGPRLEIDGRTITVLP